jgi:hypothetical protein
MSGNETAELVYTIVRCKSIEELDILINTFTNYTISDLRGNIVSQYWKLLGIDHTSEKSDEFMSDMDNVVSMWLERRKEVMFKWRPMSAGIEEKIMACQSIIELKQLIRILPYEIQQKMQTMLLRRIKEINNI